MSNSARRIGAGCAPITEVTRSPLARTNSVGARTPRTATSAGTENVVLAIALGTAAHLAVIDLAAVSHHRTQQSRDRLHALLADTVPSRVLLNGPEDTRLPNTLNVSIQGTTGHTLLAAAPGIAASTGSACHSGTHISSPVLIAMGLGSDRSIAAARPSLGRWTTTDDIDSAATQIVKTASGSDRRPEHHVPHRNQGRHGTGAVRADERAKGG